MNGSCVMWVSRSLKCWFHALFGCIDMLYKPCTCSTIDQLDKRVIKWCFWRIETCIHIVPSVCMCMWSQCDFDYDTTQNITGMMASINLLDCFITLQKWLANLFVSTIWWYSVPCECFQVSSVFYIYIIFWI